QNVSQSSNYLNQQQGVGAENAVDGNTNQYFSSRSCSHTDVETETYPSWNITFDRPYWFHLIYIYNRNAVMKRLSGFSLSMYNGKGDLIYQYTDNENTPLLVYEVSLVRDNSVRLISIEADHGPTSSRVLTLCEVEVYCNCDNSVPCSVSAGTCQYFPNYYCPPGTHGEVCEFSCSEQCLHSLCDARSGACSQCVTGYQGDFCNEDCNIGRFGQNCSNVCPRNCQNGLCDRITGACMSCLDHWTGPTCQGCNQGWFGQNCTNACSRNCRSQICDRMTGDCVSCTEHFAGLKCQECKPGWFGKNCALSCPRFCRAHLCHRETGRCLSCAGRQTGPKCE
ncbi:unnamed protein product, partial [Candidula unifasciata]